ncbi:MAG: penicillin acylase family protein [Candidatus Heimdallarchaeota archaeon]|nr:penicillin acylase family protein [Candidatus Heimdallarchaeota archaeon]
MVKNTMDYQSSSGTFSQITEEVKVYRDEKGIPTIIAGNMDDLFFAQGYEMARDRLWQLEFLRAVASGELSELIGNSTVESDIYLRTLSMRKAADYKYQVLPDDYKAILVKFTDGINAYIEDHIHNMPIEFLVLGAEPKLWEPQDTLGIQGVMSRTLSISGLNRELLRLDLAKAFGADDALDLFPIDNPDAAEYYRNFDFDAYAPSNINSALVDKMEESLNAFGLGFDIGSNNWVVGPDKTKSGNPIVNNDPHLDLQTPSIWWQVHLSAPGYHVEGFALPGVPGVVVGHNENVAWGVTNTGTDAVDLFFFKTNDQGQYYHDGQWKAFDVDPLEIVVKDGETYTYDLRYTDYGPVLDPKIFGVPEEEDLVYVMRWTLLEENPNDQITRAVLDLNKAENIDDIYDALQYWGVPGQNIVFADVNKDFGYQYTGFIPIRKNNTYGVIPQNGSSNDYGWTGYVDYNDHYRVDSRLDTTIDYFATANQKIDTRDAFYITDKYADDYRGQRINALLEAEDEITVEYMKAVQNDTYNLYAEDILSSFVMDTLSSYTFTGDNEETLNKAVTYLEKWNLEMNRSSIAATLFSTFRIYLEEFTLKDEFDDKDPELFARYSGLSTPLFREILSDKTNIWFDDISTTSTTENGDDIVIKAFEKSIDFLMEFIGKNIDSWTWDRVHEVVFNHVMGVNLGLFNEGNTPADGSTYTIKNSSGTPSWSEDGPEFTQTFGSSMRMIAEVESTWTNVYGILAPGSSGHLFYEHRDDGIEDWVENIYHTWDFSTTFSEEPDFVFNPE